MSLVVCSSQAPPPIATMTANGKLRGPNSLRRNSHHLNCLRAFGETMRVMRDGDKDAAAETRPARMVILAGWEVDKCGRPSVENKCHSRSRSKELALIANAGPGRSVVGYRHRVLVWQRKQKLCLDTSEGEYVCCCGAPDNSPRSVCPYSTAAPRAKKRAKKEITGEMTP